jgi:hypothetical protein
VAKIDNKLDRRAMALLLVSIVPVIAVFLFVDPYPQPAGYHDLADGRTMFGIPNFWNVASNAMFLVFGVAGLRLVLTGGELAILPGSKVAYAILFIGITLTALGSGWFHLGPRNDTLYWDRLPMTVAFMPLFGIIIAEHVSVRLASLLLWPLVLTGIFSVLWWDHTESIGAGDLRLYGLVQFLPMLLIPAILLMYRSAFDSIRFFWVAIGLYVLAKVFEQLDDVIFSVGGFVSGHSIKHVVASLVPLVLINGIRQRHYRGAQPPPASQITS